MTELNDQAFRYLKYLSWKMQMLRIQQENPIKLDVEQAKKNYEYLSGLVEERAEELKAVMPRKPIFSKKKPPAKPYKKDGTLSSTGESWFQFLKEQGLPESTQTEVRYISGWKEPNPTYVPEVKDWLFSLGWKPQTFKYERKDDGEVKTIPQLRYLKGHDREGELCDSVIELAEEVPEVKKLQGLSVAKHRRSLFKGKKENSGFLGSHVDGRVVAQAGGLTNTLRFQHKGAICNLPSVEAELGEYVRSVLVADEGKVMVGSDVTSLEDSLKQHFIYPYDPDYVEEMQTEGFDPHLSLGIMAGVISQEDYDFYVSGGEGDKQRYKSIKAKRKPLKGTNYSCQYGIGAPSLSRNLDVPLREAQKLKKAYDDKNWAIAKVAKEQYVKTLRDGSMWLKNPINGFYYSLRYEKDRFSTLVQGSGDYVFGMWALFCWKMGVNFCANVHDEWLTEVDEDKAEETIQIAHEAIKKVNEVLKLNKVITVDAKKGESYASVH